MFALQDEIARAVVAALKVKLLRAPTAMERSTVVPEAFDQYLLGMQHFHRSECPIAAGRSWTPLSRPTHEAAGRTACGICQP